MKTSYVTLTLTILLVLTGQHDAIGGILSKRDPSIMAKELGLAENPVNVNGISRLYYSYVPESLRGQKNIPALLVFHGGGRGATFIAQTTNFKPYADKFGFAVIYPQAADSKGRWQVGRDSTNTSDDIGYTKALLKDVYSKYNISPKRVFASGISSGGSFSHRLACEMPGYFQAFGILAANMIIEQAPKCKPSKASPIVIFAGTEDRFMLFNGGQSDLKILRNRRGESQGVISHPATVQKWVTLNNCQSAGPVVKLPDRDPDDGTTVTVQLFDNCDDNAKIKDYVIHGGGHNWPGAGTNYNRLTGYVSQDIDANAEMIKFFKQYGL